MPATVPLAAILVSWHVLATSAVDKITLVSFPVNITSWRQHLRDKLRHPLDGIPLNLKYYVDTYNASTGCVEEGGECKPDMSDCCSDFDEDMKCLPAIDSSDYVCRRLQSSEEMAQQRLNSLQYGDSKGLMNSHPWVDSWEFQSKSTMEKEEEKAAEDAEFTKNFKPKQIDNVWKKVYRNMKSGGEQLWHDLKKLEKLREIKNNLIEKYRKNYRNNDVSSNAEDVTTTTPNKILDEPTETSSSAPTCIEYPESNQEDSWIYPSDNSDSTNNDHGSDETFNRFPNHKAKKRKDNKIEFKIEDIIEDITNLLSKKLKEKDDTNKGSDNTYPFGPQDPLHHNDIMNSAERLKKEINELKKLKEKHAKTNEQQLDKSRYNDDLIKKHVATILDEERKLDKLKKLEVFKKLQEVR